LDNNANLVDEEQTVKFLEDASDYERGISRMDDKRKEIMQKLREWARELATVAGQKRKHIFLFITVNQCFSKLETLCPEKKLTSKKKPEDHALPVFNGKKENATLAKNSNSQLAL
jgi:hypothetical protein